MDLLSARLACAVAVLALASQLAWANEEGPAAIPPADDTVLRQALALDPATLARAPAKALKLPTIKPPKTFDISRTDAKPDGSGTVVVKQALPTEWDAHVGADVGLAADAADTYQPQRPLVASGNGRNSGAAWASFGLLDMASIDARVDPTTDQGRLAGTLKRSIPVGRDLSVTLLNSYAVTDAFGAQAASAPAGLPVMALPQDTASAPSQVFGNERAVKFNVLPTGTTLAAGLASTSLDPVTHNRLSAEQKLLGPLTITTALTDVGQTTANKSISAGFKLNW